MTDFNERVGANVRRFRKIAGLTQAALADRLRRQGHPFQQQTVLKVEGGNRPLKLEEAAELAEILTTPVEALYGSITQATAKDRRIDEQIKVVAELEDRTRTITEELTDTQAQLAAAQSTLDALRNGRLDEGTNQ